MASLLRMRKSLHVKIDSRYDRDLHSNGLVVTNGSGLHDDTTVDDGKTKQEEKPSTGNKQHQEQYTVILKWADLLSEAKREEPELLANDESVETELKWLQNAVSYQFHPYNSKSYRRILLIYSYFTMLFIA
jgi:hypothetical protein